MHHRPARQSLEGLRITRSTIDFLNTTLKNCHRNRTLSDKENKHLDEPCDFLICFAEPSPFSRAFNQFTR